MNKGKKEMKENKESLTIFIRRRLLRLRYKNCDSVVEIVL